MQAVGDSTAMCSNVIYANERRETSSPAITLDYCTHTAINLRPNTNNTEESVALPALPRRRGRGRRRRRIAMPLRKRPFRAFTTLPTCSPPPGGKSHFFEGGGEGALQVRDGNEIVSGCQGSLSCRERLRGRINGEHPFDELISLRSNLLALVHFCMMPRLIYLNVLLS